MNCIANKILVDQCTGLYTCSLIHSKQVTTLFNQTTTKTKKSIDYVQIKNGLML